MKGVRIRSFSSTYFPASGLNTERYEVSFRIHLECGKKRTRETPNKDTFNAAVISRQDILNHGEKKFVDNKHLANVRWLYHMPHLIFVSISPSRHWITKFYQGSSILEGTRTKSILLKQDPQLLLI